LSRLVQLLVPGPPALGSSVFSALAALLAAGCVYALVRVLLVNSCWHAYAAAGVAALWFALSPLCWSQAVIAEVYTLHALFVGLILLFLLFPRTWQAPLVGLAPGNHITVALPALVWLLAGHSAADMQQHIRRLLLRLGGLGLGLLVYAYVPLRAAAQPPINWGGASDWSGFWWLISGQHYRELAFGVPSMFLAGRVQAWATLLVQQFGWVGVGLGFAGLLYGAPRRRRFVWLSAGLAGAFSVFAIAYNTADSFAYLLPVYLIFALWMGIGVAAVLAVAQRWHAYAAAGLVVLLLAAVAWSALHTAPQVDASNDHRAARYAASVLEQAPPDALVITSSDRDSFVLWYYHFALEQRPDIVVAVEPLLQFDWYRENLRAIYPALQIPEQAGPDWMAAIIRASPSIGALCHTDVQGDIPLHCRAVRRPSGAQEPQTPGSSSAGTVP
jgi:hypothetical protein